MKISRQCPYDSLPSVARLSLLFENGESIPAVNPITAQTQSSISYSSHDETQLDIGPFQIQICSYKHDGRKFKFRIDFLNKDDHTLCYMQSHGFIVRAKKPLRHRRKPSDESPPGESIENSEQLSGKKRKRDDEEKPIATPQQLIEMFRNSDSTDRRWIIDQIMENATLSEKELIRRIHFSPQWPMPPTSFSNSTHWNYSMSAGACVWPSEISSNISGNPIHTTSDFLALQYPSNDSTPGQYMWSNQNGQLMNENAQLPQSYCMQQGMTTPNQIESDNLSSEFW